METLHNLSLTICQEVMWDSARNQALASEPHRLSAPAEVEAANPTCAPPTRGSLAGAAHREHQQGRPDWEKEAGLASAPGSVSVPGEEAGPSGQFLQQPSSACPLKVQPQSQRDTPPSR